MRTRMLSLAIPVAVVMTWGGAPGTLAQRAIQPNAALDIHVPVLPTPVRIDGRVHLVYELHLTNFSSADLSLSRISLAAGPDASKPLASFQDGALRDSLARVGPRGEGADARSIGSGSRAVFFAWLALEERAPVPPAIHHTISYSLTGPSGSLSGAVEKVVSVRLDPPVVLGPPLRGGPWIAVYDPSLSAGHRRALFAVGGAARIPARFAIDWIKLGDDNRQWRGDPAQFANWYGYGADVLAVADGTVAAAADGLPENLPRSAITADNAAGNHVTLDLGASRFAFYEHLLPGSVTVKVGDRVRAGQVIGRLGGSGSVSSGPHLHFHVADGSSALGAEGLPFVFSRFERLGAFESLAAVGTGLWTPPAGAPEASPHRVTMELPAQQTVIRMAEMSISKDPVRQGVRRQQRR